MGQTALIKWIKERGAAASITSCVALLAPLMGLLAPLGMTPLFMIVSTTLIVSTWSKKPWRAVPKSLIVMGFAIIGWAALSAFWAVDPLRSLRSAAVLAVMTVAGLWTVAAAISLEQQQKTWIQRTLVAGVGIALLYVGLDIMLGGSMTIWIKELHDASSENLRFIARQQLSRGIIILVLLSWVVAACLRHRPVLAWGIVGSTFLIALWSWSAASKLAMITGFMVMLVAGWTRLRLAAVALLVVVALMVPIAAYHLPTPAETATWSFIPFTNHHRLTIWGFTAKRIMEKPILGWGMDSARSLPGGEDISVIWVGAQEVPEQLLPLHPHNAVLQWWLELGGIGAILITGWFGLILWRSCRPFPESSYIIRGMVPAIFTGATIISLVSFGFWQSWWQSFLWLLAAWANITWHTDETPKA